MTAAEILLLITYIGLLFLAVFITVFFVNRKLNETIKAVSKMENSLGAVIAGFTEALGAMSMFIDHYADESSSDGLGQIMTPDGKYRASSMEELILKIKRDGKESEYFSDTDDSELRKLFEDDDEDDDDEEVMF